ncbi:hypothetical protein MLP_24750 [Microlunatus phosphovorus NM-1]|uniref:ATP-grasp domain-containing protein n=1 Tax=Microlunatus phosphovorus (strain ATCC 700054 / DSM 10555 / JCM 9379 / NBRC 101784 / NCIMB 13414 / VKM Ac-1990 / NM-1) TaxID=1032480 RepID=F5XFT2_MICPN|nr:hypothetical protein [Microlunatus phosphovorus]BAK35489.1 hypothetical protein MLP_24750 [Microlunatus phosphovorus NM-1]
MRHRNTPRVALATYRALPHLDSDGQRILAGLCARGLDAEACVWDDPDISWTDFDLVLLRSVWDYHHRWDQFAGWLAHVPTLINSRSVVEWNADKRYLRDLAQLGVPVVPTIYLSPDAEPDLSRLGPLDDVVVKPAISASAQDTYRCTTGTAVAAAMRRITSSGRTALVQPYLAGVDTLGEISLVFLAGSFSHAFRRAPRLRLDHEHALPNRTEPTVASGAELDLAHRALVAAPEPVSYARVDLLPDADGNPVLSELELIEPGLRLDLAPPEAVDRLVSAIERQSRQR